VLAIVAGELIVLAAQATLAPAQRAAGCKSIGGHYGPIDTGFS